MKKAIEAVLAAPWAIEDGWLDTIAAIAEREGDPEALQAKLGRPLGNTLSVSVRDGVAIIPFEGPMFRRANLMTQYSGATSYDALARDFTAALEDPSILAIIGYFDTPGGEVNGASELAAMVSAARGKKPLIAYAAGRMASAGLWVGSAFDSIIAADTAVIGSVGAQSGYTVREPKNGEKSYRFVSSQSPLKNADPETDEGRAGAQKLVDDLAAVFISTLAANRNTTTEKILSDYGQGAVFVAAEAFNRGMIDGIGTFESVLQQLSEDNLMDYSAITIASLAESRPDLVAEISATAKNDERARIAGIDALAMTGAEAIIAEAKADPSATPESTAIKVLAVVRNAKPSGNSAYLSGLKTTESGMTAPAPANIDAASEAAKDDPIQAILSAGVAAGAIKVS